MFIIYLNVNFDSIKKFRCVRVKGEVHEMCTYELEDGCLIKHHYDDGAEALAIKILKHYRRAGHKPRNRIPKWASHSKGYDRNYITPRFAEDH